MRILLLLAALAMPFVSWLSQAGLLGPTNGAMSDRYPTLVVAAGYAFAIWGLIFLLDLVFGFWQLRLRERDDATLSLVRAPAAAGFALTAAWMPVFSQGWFWLALIVIWGALACVARAMMVLSRDSSPRRGQVACAWLPLSLHAGWLSLAVVLNTAQVIVAYRLADTARMLPWSLALFGVAALILLGANQRMRGNVAYAAAALWGLAAVYVKQSQSTLPGADVAAWTAAGLALILALQTVGLRLRRPAGGAAVGDAA